MANPFVAVRITPELDAAIAHRMQETGQSRSDVVIEALKAYLGILPFTQRLTDIEQRLAALEMFAASLDTSVVGTLQDPQPAPTHLPRGHHSP